MPIRRPRGPKPALKHVAFLEAMDRLPDGSGDRKALEAAFLSLRVLDQWMWLGTEVAEPTSQVLNAAKAAVQAAAKEDAEISAALGGILDAIVLLQEPDAQPVLPRVFALAGLYDTRGQLALAADIYATVVKHVDSRAHFDLAYDALMRHAFCTRIEGVLDQSARSYESAGALAARARDRVRVLHSRVGEAKVTAAKGNLPAAESAILDAIDELRKLGDSRVLSIALHDASGVARYRENLSGAVQFAFEAFKHARDDSARERVLMDLAILLSLTGAFETARAALTLIEANSRSQEARWLATMNLMDVGTREGSETVFEEHRRALESVRLPARHEVGYLRDAGKGLAAFGRLEPAREALTRALRVATSSGLHQFEFEIETMLKDLDRVRQESVRTRPVSKPAPSDIKTAIDSLIAESTAVRT